MYLFSIIVPIYNVEDYLDECVESIMFNLKEIHFELILVDDGSTDRSGLIADSYKKEGKVKVIHKRNGGLSDARNCGIKNSNGKYIMFVDSDDKLSNLNFHEIEAILLENNPDLIIGNMDYYHGEGITSKGHSQIETQINFTKSDYLNYFMEFPNFTMEAWKLIIKKELLVNKKIFFKKKLLHEDELFTPEVICAAEYIMLYEKPFYLYRQRINTITTTHNVQRTFDKISIARQLASLANEVNKNIIEKKYLNFRAIMVLISAMGEYDLYNTYEKKKIKQLIKENSKILYTIKTYKKINYARYIFLLFGLSIFSKVQIKRGKVGKSV